MRLVWIALALLLVLPPMARAQDAAPADVTLGEAQALFRHAVELGDQDRWAEALELFRRSLELVPRPSTEFNVGFAHFRLGHFREAIAIFDSYLAETEGETSELRTEAVTRRGQAIANLAALTLELEPPDASVRVDGALDPSTGATRTITLDPGRHLVLASATGYTDAQLDLAMLSSEHRTEHLALALVAAPPIETHETSLVDDPIFWIVGASIAVAIGVGVGVGVGVATSGTTAPYAGSTGVILRMP